MNGSIIGKKVHFSDLYLNVELLDGRIISTPMNWYKDLENASFKALLNYKFICDGTGIEWSELDYHLNIGSMLMVVDQKKVA